MSGDSYKIADQEQVYNTEGYILVAPLIIWMEKDRVRFLEFNFECYKRGRDGVYPLCLGTGKQIH
jgi:hypothetical protein